MKHLVGFENSTFLNFLRTGELEQITFRTTIDDIYDSLGRPVFIDKPFDQKDLETYLVLFYGSLSITHNHNLVRTIQIDFHKGDSLPKELNIPWYQQVKQLKYREFVLFAKRYGVRCQRIVGTPNFHFDPEIEDYWVYIERGKKTTKYGVENVGLEIVFENENQSISKITSSDSETLGRRIVKDC